MYFCSTFTDTKGYISLISSVSNEKILQSVDFHQILLSKVL